MKQKESAPGVDGGNAKAAVQLMTHAVRRSELNVAWGSSNRGPRNPPYIPFDPRDRVRRVLSITADEQDAIVDIQSNEALSDRVKAKRISRLQRGFHKSHRRTVVDGLLAQKLGLAKMQMQARSMLEQGLVTENGETLHDVLARAEILKQAGKMLHSRHDGEFVAHASDVGELFPAGAFLIAENRLSISQFHAHVDDYAERLRLPPQIVADYHSLYRRMVLDSKDIHAFRKAHPTTKLCSGGVSDFIRQGTSRSSRDRYRSISGAAQWAIMPRCMPDSAAESHQPTANSSSAPA
jgi:hypothetical protein